MTENCIFQLTNYAVMISRTLGPEFGGSIGTLFFMANIVSSALCISGCAEGLVENFGPSGYLSGVNGLIPDGRWWRFLYCSVLNTANLLVCLIGAAMFAKTSVAILAIVCICLGSVIISFLAQGAMEVNIILKYVFCCVYVYFSGNTNFEKIF